VRLAQFQAKRKDLTFGTAEHLTVGDYRDPRRLKIRLTSHEAALFIVSIIGQ
jgi:hypothetical protein